MSQINRRGSSIIRLLVHGHYHSKTFYSSCRAYAAIITHIIMHSNHRRHAITMQSSMTSSLGLGFLELEGLDWARIQCIGFRAETVKNDKL